MITGPLFKWFGSKWLSSKRLPEPIHDTIVEPFAGSAGYSLRHYKRDVILYESDPHIYALWVWLIHDATEKLIRDIPIGVPVGTSIKDIGLSKGQELLLKTWQRTNNVGDCWTISPWGNKPGQWTENTRSRVADQFHSIKHWIVGGYNGIVAFNEVCKRATWFIDPPYIYNYKYKSDIIGYGELAKAIHRTPGQMIVCEAICQDTGAVPNWLPFTFFGNRITSRRKANENHHSKELIWQRLNTVF